MKIAKITILDSIEISYGKRELFYCNTGYSYWYNNIEIKNGSYSNEKWKKILARFNNGYNCRIERIK